MKKLLYILAFLLIPFATFAQLSPDNYTAHWIFNIAQKIYWPKDVKIDTFKIAVYGRSTHVASYLKQIAKEEKIQGKPVVVYSYNRFGAIPFDKINIIYVEPNKNDFLPLIIEKIKNKPILLLSYRADDKDNIMVNFIFKGRLNQFEINSFNIRQAGLKADEAILKLGGTKVDIQGLLRKKEKELLLKEKALNQKQDSIRIQRQILKQKELELKRLKFALEKQKKELELKEQELKKEKQKAGHLNDLIKQQEQILKRNELILQKQNEEITQKQKLIKQKDEQISQRQKELEKKAKELQEKINEIKRQRHILKTQKLQIHNQQIIIVLSLTFLIIVILLLTVILKWYLKIKKLNQELSIKNREIERQKNELQVQAKQLEEFNKELEKLSLVASRTNNSVIIMDKDGNFEWVNPGFTRLYGYTLQLLINELGKNIRDVSGNPRILEYIDYCLKNKTTVTYEARNKTRFGNIVWVQTSLTPILNEKDEVVKLFAIETDITKLKEQEQQIRQINEELRRQRDTLQEQKEQIELQNKLIKDSIRYAQTIQHAFLPPLSLIQKHFDAFLIYLPRDIVSGDFYWFAQTGPNQFFIAVVDCTGHGVPGAFMSLIASRMISEIILEKNVRSPKDILTQLNEAVIEALNQRTSDNDDGMDVCLVRIDKNPQNKTYTVIFSGAKRPLFFFKRELNKIDYIRGDRKSIGGKRAIRSPIEFTNKTLIFSPGDIIYLTTDGLIDQNNPKRKRFGTPRFVELLNEIKLFDLEKQKEYIEKTLRDYMQDQPQRDDITILGIKFRNK